jgi:biotin transport system substrate-specific component
MNNSNHSITEKSNRKYNTRDLVITAMFTTVICIMAQISIPIQPIPFTLALFAIFLTGATLSPRNAFFSVLVYLLLGAFGVPVFAGMKSGIYALTGMTGGYLMAYPLMAFITALFHKYSKKYKIVGLTCGMAISLLLCYIIGTLWFSFVTGNSFYTSLTLCVFPFILFDCIKIILAISVSIVLKRTIFRYLLP